MTDREIILKAIEESDEATLKKVSRWQINMIATVTMIQNAPLSIQDFLWDIKDSCKESL